MEDFCFCGFGGFAVCFGHGFGVAEGHSGGSAEDAADRPFVSIVGEEDFSGALLFGAIVPAAEEGEMIAEESEVVGFCGFLFECSDGLRGSFFGGVGW